MNEPTSIKPLSPQELCHACRLERFDFQTSADLEPLAESIGQERAVEAIQFGVEMAAPGFNLYAMGSTGLGRHTLVREALQTAAASQPPAGDWCYVANFQHPSRPRAIDLPANRGRQLRQDMERLIDDLLVSIPAAFQGDEYRRRATEIQEEFEKLQDRMAVELSDKADQRGILVSRSPTGFRLMPQKEGKALSPEEYQALPEQERERFEAAMEEMKEELRETMARIPQWQRELQRRFRQLDRETAELVISAFIEELVEAYASFPKVTAYLAEVRQDIIENVSTFQQAAEQGEGSVTARDPAFRRYRVNVLVDNGENRGAPLIFEDNPTYQNLLGRVEHIARMGTLQTDFTLIKPGALHRANGGYLVLEAEKVLTSPWAWEGLKRALRAREVRIESLEYQLSLATTISLEPQPIPIELKVVLVGDRFLFYLLKEYDPEFSLLFKVAADFSEELPRRDENELLYARLVASLQKREGLRDISREGVERILVESVRRARDGDKLSLHIGSLLDLLHEADQQARKQELNLIGKPEIEAAVEAQRHRVSQLKEQLREEILKGVIRIDTSGLQLAQVNALTYLELGDLAFGAPTRISATARLGSGEFIDIERETEQGGPIHSKGVMILTAYLGERYAKHQPLPVAASLVFEQTYGRIEGDSASAAELCALLSALGDLPLKQSLAITGSVNQHGQMQAIGGVCEKIEGFFDICQARGLDGSQGAIIPVANVRDLMLRQELVEAAREGKFHIYAVDHVEQAMELLTGLPAGVANVDGVYPDGTINAHIQVRLAQWIALRQHYAGHGKEAE